jgi:hypothetical protein
MVEFDGICTEIKFWSLDDSHDVLFKGELNVVGQRGFDVSRSDGDDCEAGFEECLEGYGS